MSLIYLMWLHFVADYPLQGEFLAQMKGKFDYLLFCHCVIWSGLLSLGLHTLDKLSIWKAVFLLIGHFIIDRWKCRKEDKTFSLTKDLWIDQILHIIQIIIVYIF